MFLGFNRSMMQIKRTPLRAQRRQRYNGPGHHQFYDWGYFIFRTAHFRSACSSEPAKAPNAASPKLHYTFVRPLKVPWLSAPRQPLQPAPVARHSVGAGRGACPPAAPPAALAGDQPLAPSPQLRASSASGRAARRPIAPAGPLAPVRHHVGCRLNSGESPGQPSCSTEP